MDLGTKGADKIRTGSGVWGMFSNIGSLFGGISYGGDGSDEILSGILNDTLIGGKGVNVLCGNSGNDLYIHSKSDGIDYIIDQQGFDCLYLKGYSSDDIIQVRSDTNSDYIDILCNDKVIVRINKACRYSLFTKCFSLRVEKDGKKTEQYLSSELFKSKNYTKRMIIACPVDIEIIDEDGKVVYTLKDAQPGSYYTEYGDLYVYEEENGDCVKVLHLIDNYSIRIIGNDTGTMNVAVADVKVEDSVDLLARDISVTSSLIATIEYDEDKVYLVLDKDGDGNEDERILMVSSFDDIAPKTGDTSCIIGIISVFIISGFGLLVSAKKKKSLIGK